MEPPSLSQLSILISWSPFPWGSTDPISFSKAIEIQTKPCFVQLEMDSWARSLRRAVQVLSGTQDLSIIVLLMVTRWLPRSQPHTCTTERWKGKGQRHLPIETLSKRKKKKKLAWNLLHSHSQHWWLLISLWRELGHMADLSCKGGWESEYWPFLVCIVGEGREKRGPWWALKKPIHRIVYTTFLNH